MYKSYPLTKEIVIDLITESGNKLNSLWYIPPTSTDWNWLKTKKNHSQIKIIKPKDYRIKKKGLVVYRYIHKHPAVYKAKRLDYKPTEDDLHEGLKWIRNHWSKHYSYEYEYVKPFIPYAYSSCEKYVLLKANKVERNMLCDHFIWVEISKFQDKIFGELYNRMLFLPL